MRLVGRKYRSSIVVPPNVLWKCVICYQVSQESIVSLASPSVCECSIIVSRALNRLRCDAVKYYPLGTNRTLLNRTSACQPGV
eukprot:SAG31_NODE_307_length_17957_cov_5.236645_21_plen_83_part_00